MKTTNQQPATVRTSPRWKQPLISTGCVLFASLLMSVNIKSFVRAGNLIPGGFTGLSLLLQRTAETFFGISLPYSVINIALNAIPAIIGFRMIGKKFTSYTVLMIVLNSFLVDLIPVTPITYDPLLVSVFGGILNGTAISIALFGKASSGGTDFIAVYLSSRLHKPSWNFVFGINVVILTTAGFLFGFEAAMYSIIFQFVSTQTINTLHRKDQKATMFIVTRHGAMLEQKIMECTRHGITHLAVQGCYLKEDKDMLYTVLGEDEVKEVTALVRSLDPEAFINIIKSEGIAGRDYLLHPGDANHPAVIRNLKTGTGTVPELRRRRVPETGNTPWTEPDLHVYRFWSSVLGNHEPYHPWTDPAVKTAGICNRCESTGCKGRTYHR